MNARWRSERELAIVSREIIGREESREEHEGVKARQQDQCAPKFVPVRHLVTPFESADRSRKGARPQADCRPQEKRKKASRSRRPRTRPARVSIPRAAGRVPASSIRFPPARRRSALSPPKTRAAK